MANGRVRTWARNLVCGSSGGACGKCLAESGSAEKRCFDCLCLPNAPSATTSLRRGEGRCGSPASGPAACSQGPQLRGRQRRRGAQHAVRLRQGTSQDPQGERHGFRGDLQGSRRGQCQEGQTSVTTWTPQLRVACPPSPPAQYLPALLSARLHCSLPQRIVWLGRWGIDLTQAPINNCMVCVRPRR